MEYLMSVDIGTTALKSSIVSRFGTIIASETKEYPLLSNRQYVEQDPHLWWDSFCAASRTLIQSHSDIMLDAIVLSGQMQDLVCIEGNKAVGNAILYSDTRAQDDFKRFVNHFGTSNLIELTYNIPDVSSLPPKIAFIFKDPRISKRSIRFALGAHDYVCWKLTGKLTTDYTNASTTSLLDYDGGIWDETIVSYLGISSEQLPLIEPASTVTGTVTTEASRESLLPAGLPVVHGAGDAGASTIGVGAGVSGRESCYLGTSGWIAATVDHPVDPSSGVFNLRHPDGKQTIAIGAMRTTGGNISWLLETFSVKIDPYKKLQEIASEAPVGSAGLFYLPYLQGERSPFVDPYARGAFIGLSKDMKKAHLFRAVIEGIAYALATIHESIHTASQRAEEQLIASGGGAENQLLIQTIAHVIGVPVLTVKNAANSGTLGNVIIGGNAIGWFNSYDLPEGFLQMDRLYTPDENIHVHYQKHLEIFKRLYKALFNEFHEIANISLS